ncbi:isoleucine--tRNA ligase, chloroplastic/mitochondrial [Carica papaya]|uniref:isoleucine--tRNA ligase, chloroplastic/mitochondrial n=1 Tax=Carica papaya TaxID=3649 RepID=UPI000B8CEFBC|nr:isoleucine--tRNA ligase, chloroplastic/mitochondrial [Carica papaya]
MSFFKSFAANSSIFSPKEATMAMMQSSPYIVRIYTHSHVLSRRTCSSFRSSSVKVFAFLNITNYSTNTGGEFLSSSKRRSRGPVMAAKKSAGGEKQEEGKYKHTVNLPKTTFGMRANALVREPEIQKMWDDNQVFKRIVEKNDGGNFVLHDGPPYANGDLHMGHALNKILKDIINRYKLLQNYKVHYVPGWDCHGLPIELKVLQSLDADVRKDLTPIKLRAKAAKFAKATVKTQMTSFKYPEGHISRSIYAIFRLVRAPTMDSLLEEFFPDLCLAVWTTTPWTIPANAAVAVNAKLQYSVVEVQSLSEDDSSSPGSKKRRLGNVLKEQKKLFLIVASDLVPTLEAKWSVKLIVNKMLLGSDLENCRYIHPIDDRECSVVLGGDYITTESGTGLVHTAPGHGQEDYVTGLKYGLPILSPVDDEGKFTEEAGQFSGLDVLDEGNIAVVKYLDEQMSLVMEESYEHKYPYDWRTKKPTIFRATEQWFASVEGFRQAAMDAIAHVKWVPPCLCSFSGSSWAAVLGTREGVSFPADLYLEGTDQHRGWFQSSLLTSVATKGKAPYSTVVTHGFVLDERGSKMSKSLGNVVDPRNVIEGGKDTKEAPGYGADVLRLWVSSVDYTGDVMIGPQVLRQMSDIYRKLRGTLRYLLANLHDWKVENAVPYHDLPMIDQHAMFQLENVVKNIRESYQNYQFFKIFQMIQRFVIVDLSNFYFDVAKDRLYVGGTSSFTRRSCQTVLAAHLLSIVRIIAPILPHLAEDVWQNLPFEYVNEDGSVAKFVFELKWPVLNETWLSFSVEDIDFWERLLEMRTEVNKVLEIARTGKLIGSSLEAKVYLHTADDSMTSRLLKMCGASNDADTLPRIFITSQAEVLSSLEDVAGRNIEYTGEYLVDGNNKVWIGVSRAEGHKCERCWNYSFQVGSFQDHPTLCSRCYKVVAIEPLPAVAAVS